MAKSRGRKFAEITTPTNGVFDITSMPTITNAKLQNSGMTLAGSSVSLGGTGVANTDALSEGSSNVYFSNARVQTFLGGGTLAGNIVVPDNRSIYVGSGSDLRIYHDTTNTQIINATGALQITSNGGFAVTGAATFSSTITATGTITGTLATAAQANITSLGTLSALTISGDLTVDTSTLKVDSSNNRVGIGNTSPNRQLSLKHASQAEIGFKTGSVSNGALIYYNDSENQLLLRAQESGEHIAFQTGGTTERLRIDSSGDLNIVNTGQASLNYTTDGSADYARITGGKSGSGVGDLRFFTYSGGIAERMRITSDGKVGIGTGASVATKLNVIDSAALQAQFSGYSHASASNNARAASGSLRLGNGAGSTGFLFDYTDQGQTVALIKNEYVASTSSELRLQSPFLSFYTGTSPAERLRINARGALVFTPSSGTEVNNSIVAHTNNYMYMLGNTAGLILQNNTVGDARIRIDDSNLIRLETNAQERMRIQNDGHIRVNPGSTDYTSHTNVDKYLFTVQTSYTANGSQNLNIVNHNGNWTDGTTGTDSAYGLMWGYENSVRAGIHYDHRGSEKFDFYSSYAPFRFRVPPSVNGNISPIGSETTMPAALAIAPGGYVGIGPGSNGAPSPNALLSVVGSNSNTAADAAVWIASGGTSDWSQVIYEPSEYALDIRVGSSMSYAFYIRDASTGSQRFRIAGNGAAFHSGTTAVTSDERKKKNIVDMPSQWDEFKQIRWRNFEWKDGAIEGTQFGVIAQEIQAFNPDLIIVDPQTKEEIEESAEDQQMLSVMYEMLHTKGMKALQEAMARIETLEAEVKALKGE